MYSVILMAAMTTGGEVPAFQHWRGGHGCYGCSGCNGCWGGCNGCWGGGYTYAGIGYYGYGCWGYGCNNCSGYYGCYGGWTCYGGFGCTGAPHVFSMVPIAPNGPVNGVPETPNNGNKNGNANPEKKGTNKDDKDGKAAPDDGDTQQVSLTPDRARLIVTLPADAKLFVDNRAMQTLSERRVFHSPRLDPGQLYVYNLRAEVVRGGRTLTREQRVVVRGGSVTRASFTDFPDTPTMTVQR